MAKETFDKMKRQHMDWEKIFVNNMNKRRLISNIYKQVIQLSITTNSSIKKIGRRTEKMFYQRGTGQNFFERNT